MSFSITRRIEIDMGHRVPTHGSKCWNIHGHRYVILAEAVSIENLQDEGEQTDMVMDFGFLKTIMMDKIYDTCDHGLVLWRRDSWLPKFISNPLLLEAALQSESNYFLQGDKHSNQTKLLVVPFVPTAERLAEYWFHRMSESVKRLSKNTASLAQVIVQETPNSIAYFPPGLKTYPGSTFTSRARSRGAEAL